MSTAKINITPIHLQPSNAVDANLADHDSLRAHFVRLAAFVNEACHQRVAASTATADAPGLIAVVGDFLPVMRDLDAQYGADHVLPLNDAADAVDESLQCLATLDAWLGRLGQAAWRGDLRTLLLGIGYWAMRHHLPIYAAAPIANALAERSNLTETRQETAAVYALMQGFIHHLAPALKADLERSNPERAWRVLNLNFAITAIRTGDAAMMRFAFDTLNAHLPDERRGFYEEAFALASQPGFPVETRAMIEAEQARWARVH